MIDNTELNWRKSTFSGNNGGQCVEVAFAPDTVHIRHSKHLEPTITIPAGDWPPFLQHVSGASPEGVTPHSPSLSVDRTSSGDATLRSTDGVAIGYTSGEWAAFLSGVEAGEFDQTA